VTTYLVRKSGSDINGGTSPTVRSVVADGVTNGTNTLTSVTAAWSAADVGHGIFINGVNQWRLITAVASAGSLTFSGATIAAGSGRVCVIGGAWATLGLALGGSTPITSGDTLYVGSGIYREAVTVGVAPTSTLNVIGDVDGAQTGDAGEVRWTGMTAANGGDFAGGSTGVPLNNNTKNFLAYSNIVFVASSTSAPVSGLGGHDNSFTDCAFFASASLAVTATVDTASNLTFDRCYFQSVTGNANCLSFTLPTSTTADYDVNILVRNCLLFSQGGTGVNVTATGANSFKGGGVDVRSCTVIASNGFNTSVANVSTSIPCTVYDCFTITSGTAIAANTSGQWVEDYNVLNAGTLRTNVTAGTHSNTISRFVPYISMGQERIWGGQSRPFGSPVRDSLPHGWGSQSGGPSVDILNRPRPAGINRVLFTGTATSGAATTLTDSGATWGANQLASAVCKITGGTGSGQTKIIKSHTGTVLTFYGNWKTNPDNTSTYAIYFGTPSETFTCTSGSTTTAVQSSASWVTNMWAGFVLEVTAGTGNGQTTTITSNNGTTLTVPTLATGLDNTSECVIYKQTSVDAVNKTAGAFERHDTAEKETGTTDAGSVGIVLTGWADHAIYVPVDATSTTISVKARYDSTHGTTNKPQAILDANGEIGVTTETVTMTSAADTWETLTFAAQTPSAKGWVTVRLVGRSDGATGRAYFDTVVVA
jgi:hypothetical protein